MTWYCQGYYAMPCSLCLDSTDAFSLMSLITLHGSMHAGEHPACNIGITQKPTSRQSGQTDRQTCSATPYAPFGGVCWQLRRKSRPVKQLCSPLEAWAMLLGMGPQHCLHHGQVLHVLMCLEQSIACKQQWASGTALLCCDLHSLAMQYVCFLMLLAVLF